METNKLLAVDSLSDSDIFLERLLPVSRQGRPWPWIVSSALLAILSIALFFRPAAEQSCIADTKTYSDSCIERCKQQVWRRSDFRKYEVLCHLSLEIAVANLEFEISGCKRSD
jgi:uncharacterized protein (DUF2126 family)